MEFHEKLQELRKIRGLTQEELAEALFVSRTAISKWESGRGYPSIDSLKEISRYFSVSIDDLLSLMLIFLPLYSKPINSYIYSVNLLGYVNNNTLIIKIYWALYISLATIGIVKMLMVYFKLEKGKKMITDLSVGISIIAVLFLAMAKEPYATTVMFLLLLIKGGLFYRQAKVG